MQLPNPPTGNTNEASTIRKIINCLKSFRLKSGVGYRVKTTTEGTFLELEPQKGSGNQDPPVWL